MVGMTGTFSGTFKADEVDIISHANIRNGAVTSYMQFSRKKRPGEDTILDLEWTVPAQAIESVIDITIPCTLRLNGGAQVPAVVVVMRNGVEIARSSVGPNGWEISLFYSIRYMDFTNPVGVACTYKVYIIPATSNGQPSSGARFWMKGKALTGIRKR
ncbi:MAG: hypothetical protein RR740_00160 [Pseudomonas sp.]